MRHEKAVLVLDLARRLAGSAEGLTLDDMAEALGVGRRTAERLRDAVMALYPQTEEVADPPTKRWRIRGGLSAFEQAPTAPELLELAKAAEALRKAGEPARAAQLEGLERKVRAALRSTALNRLAPDLEALARAETISVQAGPRPFEDAAVLSTIREAIMAGRALEFAYMAGSTPGRRRTVAPCGLMFARSNYLVAADLGQAEPRTFRLDSVREPRVTDTPAHPPPGFDLQAFAARSFGIYQDAVEDVVLRIDARRADEARAWRFHPTQTLSDLPDGGVEVRFTASGMRELAWHLFSWEDSVSILAPPRLKTQMIDLLERALAKHSCG